MYIQLPAHTTTHTTIHTYHYTHIPPYTHTTTRTHHRLLRNQTTPGEIDQLTDPEEDTGDLDSADLELSGDYLENYDRDDLLLPGMQEDHFSKPLVGEPMILNDLETILSDL